MTRSPSRLRLLFPAIAFLALACDSGNSAPKVPLAQAAIDSSPKAVEAAHALLGPEAKAALDSGNVMMYKAKADSGNAAKRNEDYARALADYRRASELAPQHSAPLFGIQMVAAATNNKALADSATVAIRARQPAGDSSGTLGSPHSMSDSALKALRAQMKKGVKPT